MTVKIYSTPTCPYCKLVKDYFKEQEISFSDVDVANNASAANDMVKLSGQMGVPVIDIDGTIIVGWNKSALEEALHQKQKAKQAV
ncbi:NrdH-redoxin [Candidatus Uhrbacteria bacterium]|nr:NrdH-redoxin [Candidatus Uhrbacteria bacterium]